MKRLALLSLAAVVAFAIWLSVPAGDTAPQSPAPATPVSSSNEPAIPVDATASTPRGDNTRSAVATPPPAPGAAPIGGSPKALRGTFVVIDERGVEHDREHGAFTLVLWRDDIGTQRKTVLHEGSWQVEVDELPTKVSIEEAHIGGRRVRCDDEVPVDGNGGPLALRGRWVPMLCLRVLGDDTGADLAEVRLVTSNDWMSPNPHPGNRSVEVIVERGASPLRFEPTRTTGTQNVWARAPGYAWDLIKLDTESANERMMRLVAGGDVDVTLVGGSAPKDATLRVRQPVVRPPGMNDEVWQTFEAEARGIPLAELTPQTAGATRIDGLHTGTWTISLEMGDWFRNPISLGSTTVEITAGAIASAVITLRGDTKEPPRAHAAGTLVVPDAWGAEVALTIEAKGATKAWYGEELHFGAGDLRRTAPGEFAWDAHDLPVGDYQVLVNGTEYRTRFALPPQGDEHVRIVVPEPCEVSVRVLDAETGHAIPGDWTPGWFSTPPEWEGGWSHAQTTAQPDGTFHFRAPPGPITIHAHPDGYLWSHDTYDVHQGNNEFVLQLQRASGVEIVLEDGETTVPWPEMLQVELEDAKGESVVAYWSGNRVAAKRLGEFTLKIDTVPGYEAIPPRQVVLAPGEWRKIEIALRRKQ